MPAMPVVRPVYLSPLRWSLHGLFVLALVLSAWGKVAAPANDGSGFKGIQHSLAELKCIGNSINGDPPESDPVVLVLESVAVADAPATVGIACSRQFSPMVHQLRDRLMHAPPALS